MIKLFCDCCGKEIVTHNDKHKFSWKCHLSDTVNGKMSEYEIISTDGKYHWASEREDAAELCTSCYNEIVLLSVKKYFEMKEKNNV